MGPNSLNDVKQGIFVYEDLDGKLVIGMSNNLIDRKEIAYKLLTEALDVVTLDLLQDQLKDSTNLH
jgi:hypothetical protein